MSLETVERTGLMPLVEVVRRALRPWREEGQARFKVEGPAVHLDTKRALALGSLTARRT